jgi:hypothetical protein
MQTIQAIDASHGLVAFGTESGVLEVFDLSAVRENYPPPLFTKLNLTTIVETVRFNHTGELIAFGSSGKKDAFRVLHVRSKSVFWNWPTQNSPISFLRTAAFDSTFYRLGTTKALSHSGNSPSIAGRQQTIRANKCQTFLNCPRNELPIRFQLFDVREGCLPTRLAPLCGRDTNREDTPRLFISLMLALTASCHGQARRISIDTWSV